MKVPSEIASLQPYQPGKPMAETQRQYGLKKVYKLASNESPLPPSPAVVAAVTAALHELNRYPDGSCFEMRQALSEHFQVPPDWLIFGNGSDELVDMLVQVYCRVGEAILTSEGAFSAYEISATSVLVKSIKTKLLPDLKFDLAKMSQELKSNASIRMVFLPNPNNPTGTYFNHQEFSDFMTVAKDQDVFVVLDEAYIEFVRAQDYPAGREFQKKFPNILLLRTLSKVFGLAALRIGVLIAPPDVCSMLQRIRKPFNVNSLAQVAAVAAVKDRSTLAQLQQITWTGLDYFYRELNALGLPFCPSQANFVLFDTLRDAGVVYEALLREGVILRPVKGYGFPQHLRLSVGLAEENQAAIAALKKVLPTIPLAGGRP